MQHELNTNFSILSVISYYDIFAHPLSAEEIHFRMSKSETIENIKIELDALVESKLINKHKDYFFLPHHSNEIVEQRKEKEILAKQFLEKSKKYSSIISKFPFVRAVCISGSLSKGVMEKDGDVDYFIITEKGRLWICRSLLILFKKVFLFNSRKYFCTNYFVDLNNLEIPDKNLFTATEINSLKPVFSTIHFDAFVKQNNWTNEFQPNYVRKDETSSTKDSNTFKRIIEKSLSGKKGEKLDTYFFKLTLNRWRKKFPSFDEAEFDLHMRSRKNVSKHHPRAYQTKVLDKHKESLEKLSTQLNSLITEAA